jgi:hypothetical protein
MQKKNIYANVLSFFVASIGQPIFEEERYGALFFFREAGGLRFRPTSTQWFEPAAGLTIWKILVLEERAGSRKSKK